MGFVERQLASDTHTGKAGVYLPNALAVIRFGIHCYGVTAPGHGYLGTKVGVRLGLITKVGVRLSLCALTPAFAVWVKWRLLCVSLHKR
jgi:hypothetical protein